MLQIGDRAPQFMLQDDTGKTVSLSEYRGKTLILYFYPKDETPGCTKEACDFRDHYQQFLKQGAALLGVSRDSVESHAAFKKKFQLPFPLLSDDCGTMTEAYGVWVKKSMYGKTYMGIERTTVVINGSGVIREMIRKVKVDGHVQEMLSKV